MRRWILLAGVLVLLGGCTAPGGVDGDLADDWTVSAQPAIVPPVAGTCQKLPSSDVMSLLTYAPVDCQQNHMVETAFVGTFSGTAAQRTSPPPAGSPERRAAFAECDTKVREFLGGDWRAAKLNMLVVLPTAKGWAGGARWFMCDVNEIKDLADYDEVNRTSSLKDALKSASPLHRGCAKYTREDGASSAACNTPHTGEFAGVFFAPDVPYVDTEKNRDFYIDGCESVIAKFVGATNNSSLWTRLGMFWYTPTKEEWEAGDRGTGCYLWTDDVTVNRSLRSVGFAGLPRA